MEILSVCTSEVEGVCACSGRHSPQYVLTLILTSVSSLRGASCLHFTDLTAEYREGLTMLLRAGEWGMAMVEDGGHRGGKLSTTRLEGVPALWLSTSAQAWLAIRDQAGTQPS